MSAIPNSSVYTLLARLNYLRKMDRRLRWLGPLTRKRRNIISEEISKIGQVLFDSPSTKYF